MPSPSDLMRLAGRALAKEAGRRARRRGEDASGRDGNRWLRDPRTAVWFAVAALVLIGGGRKLLQGLRARRAVGRLEEPGVRPETVLAAAEHGRAGLIELFRILGTAESEALRAAAGRALATIWGQDNLIPEEEKALVRRGFAVTWRARRRYPRALRAPIPVAVPYGVPFLQGDGPGIHPENLEWSHRIQGARRADLETSSPWRAGPGRAEFTLVPGDFDTNGPHRLVLQARVRTRGLTGDWELELPHVPFTFEFDPVLQVDALFTLPDEARGAALERCIRLERVDADEERPATYLDLNGELALRDPPELVVATPLPCDLAHAVALEFEGVPGRCPAGAVIVSGQGSGSGQAAAARRFPLGPAPSEAIDRPGARRLRAVLTADPELGWADPDVRSIWPGAIETDWVEVQVVRR